MENNNVKKQELNEYDCEVFISRCAAISETVCAITLNDAIEYLKKKYPEALSVREADHWRWTRIVKEVANNQSYMLRQ